MSQSKDVVVRLQALDGQWEVGGVDRKRGIAPENVVLSANAWGPDIASFDMRRDPKAIWPDLGAWTLVEIDIGGVTVWDGRVRETPSRDGTDRVMSVQCEGWQYHLDDNIFERVYVHNRLADWKDARSFASAPLGSGGGQYPVGWQVNSGDGVIVITKPNGFNPGSFTRAGILLDGGSLGAIARLTGRYDTSGAWGATSTLYAASGQTAAAALSAGATSLGTVAAGLSQPFTFSPIPARYMLLFVDSNAAAAADEWLRFTQLMAWGSTVWDTSYTTSVLKGSDVITDGLDRATMLLSSDRSGIAVPSFSIPSFAPAGPRTARENWEAVNAYYDNISKIEVGRRPIFKPRPTAPFLEVGSWSAMEQEDASQNSGSEIYNGVLVTAQTPDGTPFSLRRSSVQSGVGLIPAGGPQPQIPNPSADVDVSGWLAPGNSRVNRDTATFQSAPASIAFSSVLGTMTAGDVVEASFVPGFRFRAGLTYALSIQARSSSAGAAVLLMFGDTSGITGAAWPIADMFPTYSEANYSRLEIPSMPATFSEYTVYWVPTVDVDSGPVVLKVTIGQGTLPANIWLDTVRIYRVGNTLVDRRGFTRAKELQVSAPLPADGVAAAQLGDVWLKGHRVTPFKGSVKLSGDQAVRLTTTGEYVPLERLLLYTGELLRFSDRIDPDTGGVGRDGRMVTVKYDHNRNEVTAALDDTRSNFEALLARLAVVTGGS